MNSIDLFAGAGGLSLGLSQAGINVVLANELEEDFAATYQANHPNTRMRVDDIARIDFAAEIKALELTGNIHLVCGGPPCQGFSTVGKKDLDDPRNSLFQQFLRCVDETNPEAIIFENVAGFKTMYQGRVYHELIEHLTSRGFVTDTKILNAVDFGLAQYRKRTIVVGIRSDKLVEWPTAQYSNDSDGLFGALPPYRVLMDAISDLPPLSACGQSDEYLSEPQNEFQEAMRDGASELTEHNCANYGQRMQEILKIIPPGGSVHDLPERLRPKGYFANTYARLVPDQPSPTITRNFGTPSSSRCVHPHQNRALSTREGARLQGFPDWYKFIGSKTSKNLQIGNAVPPPLGKALGQMMQKMLAPDASMSLTMPK
ncbi:MAG: DNA cytosine methyltransferase [Phycisphaerales bacterium]|nr:DNA cytosine methyltransferase [Phycisphaerales bacterium]